MMATHKKMFRYRGRSMWPCFQDGDLLEFEPCALAQLSVGDCVVYSVGDNKQVTHRVVAKGDSLTTRGDAMAAPDRDTVTAEQVIGKIVRRHRLGKASKINGRFAGWLAGRFYHYAGRIDPQRNALGGRVARALRAASMRGGKRFWRRGRKRTLLSSQDQEVTFWMIGRRAIGKRNIDSGQWQIAWPWNIVVAIEEE